MTDLSTAAAALAAKGWKVFPLRPGIKRPAVVDWPNVATDDAATVAAWWRKTPAANVGLATGHRGVFTLDVDSHDGAAGFTSLAALEAQHGPLPDTLTATTATGGRHLYFAAAEPIRNSAGKLGAGLDVRGAGGYVVAPPSVTPAGAYSWARVVPIAPAPAWLVELALRAAPVAADTPRASAPATIEATPEQVEDARSALAALDADDRDEWIAAAAALRCLGDAGHSLWCEWSQRSTKWQDSDEGTFYTVAADHSGLPALFARAQARGWVNPRAGRALDAAVVFGGTAEAFSPTSDVANAIRIQRHFADRLLFVAGIGWHVRSEGAPWRHDEPGAHRVAQGLGLLIAAEARALPDDDARAKLFKWAASSEARKAVVAAMALAESRLLACAEDMDADPHLLGTPSGVLDLRAGTIHPYTAADRITKRIACDFDPAATAPTWERFIAEAMGNDVELIDYLQRLAGYALTGARDEHVLPVFYGSGANGKSTFLGTLQTLLGDYACTAAPGLLIQSAGQQHASATANLQGRRLVVVSETGENGRLNEEKVKALTGGDRIHARHLYQAGFEFTPSHLIVMQTNHKPRVVGQDEGLWRRLRLVPFTVTVPEARRDRELPSKLRGELPGILAWCWRGLLAYQRDGLQRVPAAVRDATAEYQTASDQIGAWLDDCCAEDRTATTAAADLYLSYSTWCAQQGERPRSQRDLAARLAERGFRGAKSHGVRRWQGIALANSGIFSLREISEIPDAVKIH